MKMIILIWAEDETGAIGKDGHLPWRLPNDMRFFKEKTTGHAIVMGRKTFQSMNERPLPNRDNYVLTRQADYKKSGVHVIQDIKDLPHERVVYVIGGSEIYKLFLPMADVLIRTKIVGDFSGDTFFPEVDWNQWQLTEEIIGQEDDRNKYAHSFQTFHRK